MSKKVLIYSHVALWEIHHAETVELILKNIAVGNSVFVMSCRGDLVSCPANAFHDESACANCRKQTKYSLEKLLKNKTTNIDLVLNESEFEDCLPEEISVSSLQNFSYKDVPVGELVLSQLADDEKDCYLDFSVPSLLARTKSLLSNSIALYEFTKNVIQLHDVDVVYAWNGRRCSDGPVLYAAQQLGKEFFAYISGGRKNSYMTLPALKIHDLPTNKRLVDSLYVEASKRYSREQLHSKAGEIYHTARYGGEDYPGMVFFGKNFETAPKKDAKDKKKTLTIFTSSFWEFFAMGDWFVGNYPYKNFYDGIIEILSDPRINEQYQIVVRWHPNLVNAGDAERKLVHEIIGKFPNIKQYAAEHKVNSYDLLESSDVVLTFGSTIGIEATYYGRPSILLGPSIYEDTNACYRPSTHEQLVALLQEGDLQPLEKLGALKYGYYLKYGAQHEFTELRQINNNHFMYKLTPLSVNASSVLFSWILNSMPGATFAKLQYRKLKASLNNYFPN